MSHLLTNQLNFSLGRQPVGDGGGGGAFPHVRAGGGGGSIRNVPPTFCPKKRENHLGLLTYCAPFDPFSPLITVMFGRPTTPPDTQQRPAA